MNTKPGFYVIWLVSGTLIAQTSIGFKNSRDVEDLKDYRLPTWGYTSLLFHFRLDGSFSDFKYLDDDRENSNFFGTFYPWLAHYRESEKSVFDFTGSMGISYHYQRDKTNDIHFEENRSENRYLRYFLAGRWQRYMGKQPFLLLSGHISGSYSEIEKDTNILGVEETTRETPKSFHGIWQVGIGIGRIRNVTPVIRALRFRERLHALGKSGLLTGEDVQFLAQTMAKLSGFHRVYDRYGKYFWDKVYENIDIPNLSPFEVSYLAESLDEHIGVRWQGWDASIGFLFASDYYHFPSDHPEDDVDTKKLGFFTQARWYTNLTLNHQLGFEGTASYSHFLEDHPDLDSEVHFGAMIEYRWVVCDRVLWENRFRVFLASSKGLKENATGSARNNKKNYLFDSMFQFYIENDLALTTGMSMHIRQDENVESERLESSMWRMNMGLTYYLDRKLLY